MKFLIYFVLFLISSLAFCQDYKLEINPNWHKYSKIIEVNLAFKNSKTEYILKNGKVVNMNIFYEDSSALSKSYIYDKHNNVEFEINNLRKDTL